MGGLSYDLSSLSTLGVEIRPFSVSSIIHRVDSTTSSLSESILCGLRKKKKNEKIEEKRGC